MFWHEIYTYILVQKNNQTNTIMKKMIFAMMLTAGIMLASCGNKTTENVEVEETVIEETAPEIEEDVLEIEEDSTQVEEAQ